jgi:hypothetical protein
MGIEYASLETISRSIQGPLASKRFQSRTLLVNGTGETNEIQKSSQLTTAQSQQPPRPRLAPHGAQEVSPRRPPLSPI